MPHLRRAWLAAAAGIVALIGQPGMAQDHVGRLYQGSPPGSADWTEPLVVHLSDDGEQRFNVSDPRIQVFLPPPEKANGAAVIMLPGGGLRVLGIDQDTRDTIRRFNAEGVAVALLEYRTLQLAPDEIERATAARPARERPTSFPKLEIRNANANPAPGNQALDEVLRLAVMDAQQALRFLRGQAGAWNIDPARVGLFGTSAGGGVAFGVMLAGEEGATPDFIVSNFGPALQDVTVPHDAPPLFLITEAAHGPVTDGLVALFEMWKDAGEHAELHVYDVPNFSMSVSLWGDRLFDWLRSRGIIPRGKN